MSTQVLKTNKVTSHPLLLDLAPISFKDLNSHNHWQNKTYCFAICHFYMPPSIHISLLLVSPSRLALLCKMIDRHAKIALCAHGCIIRFLFSLFLIIDLIITIKYKSFSEHLL